MLYVMNYALLDLVGRIGSKDVPDKGLYVQKKGRFSVTSADVELMEV